MKTRVCFSSVSLILKARCEPPVLHRRNGSSCARHGINAVRRNQISKMVKKCYALFVVETGLIGSMSITPLQWCITPVHVVLLLWLIDLALCERNDCMEELRQEQQIYGDSRYMGRTDEEVDEVDEEEGVDDGVEDISAMLRNLGRSYRSR